MSATSRSRSTPKDALIKFLFKLGGGAHRSLYRLTGGALGGRIWGGSILLLTSTGRKSGRAYTRPLMYFRDSEDLVVVGSNGGLDRDPGWCSNLRTNPHAVVELGRRKIRVRAEEAGAEQREHLWQVVVSQAPIYEQYRNSTQREIPLMILHPQV